MIRDWLQNRIPFVFAVGFALITLLGLLFYLPLGNVMLHWGIFLGAVTLLLGIFNLIMIHGKRWLKSPLKNWNSFALLLSFSLVLVAAALDQLGKVSGSPTDWLAFVFASFIWPIEAALGSLLLFFLIFATYRMLAHRPTIWTFLILLAVVFTLFLRTPFPIASLEMIVGWRPQALLVTNTIVISGIRGLLLGVALGGIILGIRFLMGMERPYNK